MDGSKRQIDLGAKAANWPTPRGEDGESCGNHPGATDSLTGASKLWRTPDAAGEGGPRNRQASIGDGHQVTIAEQAEHRATPNAHDGTGARGKGFELTDCHYKPHDLVSQTDSWKTPHGMSNRDFRGKVGGCGGGEFAKQANQWQTPATDSFRSRGGDRKDEQGLDQQARMFPTPRTTDAKTGTRRTRPDGSLIAPQLSDVAHSLPDQTIPDGQSSFETSPHSPRRLNPQFVEWLMGFPIGWSKP